MRVWTILFYLSSIIWTSDACWPGSYGSWHSWGPCSASCGGGTRDRVKYSCVLNKARHDSGNCNQFCYNGGTFNHGCHCPIWRSGVCCEDCQHVDIDHCKPGAQECGGSPDSVRCTDCDNPYRPAGWGNGCERKPCNDDNGGCEHTCIYIRGVSTCGCQNGFVLQNDEYSCTDVDECSTGAALCTQLCTNIPGSYNCSCRQGFSLDSDGHTCTDIDECLDSTNGCQHVCLNEEGTYTCGCRTGFDLQSDGRTCVEIDECIVNNGGCDQICINEIGSFHCQCQLGYSLGPDNKCIDVDECAERNAKCTQNCINTPGSYICYCGPGFDLSTDGFTCSDIDECVDITCHNGGTCIDQLQSYFCTCLAGYTGEHCETDINECEGFMNGGCEDECINTDGSYKCSCYENRTLDTDRYSCSGGNELQVPTVFERESIFRRFLPRGCHQVMLAKCTDGKHVELLLSSTSSWYKLATNSSVMYTDGVVFAEVNDLSLPVSITGMTVEKTELDFRLLTGSLRYNEADGIELNYKTSAQHCWSFDFTPRDVHDFLTSNSFFKTFFAHLDITLPDWLQFSDNGSELFELSGVKSELLRGNEVDRSICHGAPVLSDRLYTMLTFNHDVSMSFYGVEVTLPKSLTGQYCILIDICQDLGSTLFLLLPPDGRGVLSRIPLFAKLKEKYNLNILPRGIGLSLKKSINSHYQRSEMEFWNGDRTFNYPLSEKANFWIAGDADIHKSVIRAQGRADMYLSMPSPLTMEAAILEREPKAKCNMSIHWLEFLRKPIKCAPFIYDGYDILPAKCPTLLSGVFKEEWDIQFTASMKSSFVIPLFGQTYYLDFGEAALEGYGSVGGTAARSWCGPLANPSGLFVSFFARLNPFLGIPILEKIVLNIESKVLAFITFNPEERNSNGISTDSLTEIPDLRSMFANLTRLANETRNKYNDVLSVDSKTLLAEIVQSGSSLQQRTGYISRSISLSEFVTLVSDLWGEVNRKLKKTIEEFIDTIEFNVIGANGQLVALLQHEFNVIKTFITGTLNRIVDEVFDFVSNMEGFGIKFKGELDIFHIKIIGADIELVYSVDNLGQCSQYAEMFEIFKGERALRLKIGLSTKLFRIAPFIRPDIGRYYNLAISIDNPERIALQGGSTFSLFGITGSTSFTITPLMIMFRAEGRVWDTFFADLQCSAHHNEDWDSLVLNVHGRLLAKSEDGSSFSGSYGDGLRRIFQKVADGASDRIGTVQSAVDSAQMSLTKAQDWLESKKDDVRKANIYFDDAINAMDIAKGKLEEAKGPFNQAMEKLNAAQRNVDNICRIKNCRRICVPGLSCKICHKKILFVRLPYPCCHFTDCMFSFPEPLCAFENLGCRAIRALAYVALEAAKFFVRIPLLALDVAKEAVSISQLVVDKSRFLLDVAIGAIDLAKFGLEAEKVLLKIENMALEGVKFILKGAVKVVNFIIKEGLQRIIDVKDCQFNVQVGTSDPQVFDVSCQVNPFMLGWVEVEIRINFKDGHRSLWNAAKGTVDTLVQYAPNHDTQRRKRDLTVATLGKLNQMLRNSRDLDLETDDIDIKLDEKINAVINTVGMRNLSSITDYDNRVDVFAEKCDSYTFVSSFMIRANDVLQSMVNETADMFDELKSRSEELDSFDIDQLRETMSVHDFGINTTAAIEDFNITTEQMETEINKAKANFSDDPLLSEIKSLLKLSKDHVDTQQNNVDNVRVVSLWLTAMDNISSTYFDESTCVSFIDCMHYSITTLYSLFDEEHFKNVSVSLDAVSSWEEIFLNLTSSREHSVHAVKSMSVALRNQTDDLENSDVFCSTAPTLRQQPTNTTAGRGTTVTILCEAAGDPKPDVWWYKNGELIENETGDTLILRNVTDNDTSIYSCIVGNVVANLTSDEAQVFVTDEIVATTTDVKTSQDSDVVIVVVVVTGCLLAVVLAGVMVWRRYKRYQFRKEARQGSVGSLNMIRPYTAPSKTAFDTARVTAGGISTCHR